MTPNYESEWIDQFIDALLRDPNASAPPELDDETVDLLRSLVRKPSLQAVQDRVWIRARLAAQHKPSSNGNHSHTTQVRMEESVNISIARSQPRAVAFSYTLIAAVIAVVLMGTLFIVFGSDDPLSPAAPQRETPTMIPTSTPLSNMPQPGAPTVPPGGPTFVPVTEVPPMGSPVDPALMPGTALPPSPVATATPIGMQMYPITLGGMAEMGELRPDAPVMSYTFSVEKAQNIAIFVLSNAFVPQISTSFSTENGGGGGGGGGGSLPPLPVVAWGAILMPERSVGTITINSADDAYGPFIISVQPLSTEPEIRYGETSEGRLSPTRPMMLYSFEGHGGDSISAVVNGINNLNTELVLFDPHGLILLTDNDSGAGVNPELPETILTEDGIYTLGVAISVPEQEGAFDLTVNLDKTTTLATPQPENALPIEVGQTVQGRLNDDTPILTYVFTSDEETQIVALTLGSDFTPIITSLSPEALANDEMGVPAFKNWKVAAGEPNYVSVQRGYDGVGGDFVLGLLPILSEPTLAYGDTVSGELGPEQPFVIYAFEATGGDIFSATVNAEPNTKISLVDSSLMRWGDDFDGGSGFNPELAGIPIPMDGLYYLIVEIEDLSQSGVYELSLSRDGLETLRAPDINNAITLEIGTTVQGTITEAGGPQTYVFPLLEEQRVLIYAQSPDFLPGLATMVTTAEGGGGGGGGIGGSEEIPLPDIEYAMLNLPAESQGWISVQPVGRSKGNFTFSLQPLPTEATLTYDHSIRDMLSGVQPFLVFAFEGHLGDQISVYAEGDVAGETALFDPTGTMIQQGTISGTELRNIQLPQDGLYYVTVGLLDVTQAGTYTLTVTNE